MKHMYSDQLVAYFFNEIDIDTKSNIERELASNDLLRMEFQELQESIEMITLCPPPSPRAEVVENIIKASIDSEPILTH